MTLLVGAACFVVAGIWIAPRKPAIGYPAIVFFGLGVLVAVVNLLPGSAYLLIDESGFTYASLFRKHCVPWDQIDSFVPIRIGMRQMVGWKYNSSHHGLPRLRTFNVALAGAEAALPDTYGKSAAELIGLLEDCRTRYARS